MATLDDMRQAADALADRLGGRENATTAQRIFEATGLPLPTASACIAANILASGESFEWRDVCDVSLWVSEAIADSRSAFTERGDLVIGGGTGEGREDCPQHCELLHCVFGNPFRPLPARSFDSGLRGLARSIYDGDRNLYPILADALEELGEAQAAGHCRLPLHAPKGCHVTDWILGMT
jgi:hypothetical protein